MLRYVHCNRPGIKKAADFKKLPPSIISIETSSPPFLTVNHFLIERTCPFIPEKANN